MAEVRTGVLVVGGGVTGLAFAQALVADDYLLCEASDDVGGYCRTVRGTASCGTTRVTSSIFGIPRSKKSW